MEILAAPIRMANCPVFFMEYRIIFRLAPCLAVLFMLGGCGLLGGGSDLNKLDAPIVQLTGDPIAYTVEIATSPDDFPDLKSRMAAHSQLVMLAQEPPDSLLGLERRANQDRDIALELLKSLGYYSGRVRVEILEAERPVKVILTLTPREQYTIGEIQITYQPEPYVPPEFKNRTRVDGTFFKRIINLRPPSFPKKLRQVDPGDPAIADNILTAVDSLPLTLQRRGYPMASLVNARYMINREQRAINAEIIVNPGFAALMGPVEIRGADRVDPEYIRRLVPWKDDSPWNSGTLASFRETLHQLGLFSVVEINPIFPDPENAAGGQGILPGTGWVDVEAEGGSGLRSTELITAAQAATRGDPDESGPKSDPDAKPAIPQTGAAGGSAPAPGEDVSTAGQDSLPDIKAEPVQSSGARPETVRIVPIEIKVTEAAPRTVSAEFNYDTDAGFGFKGAWEHRNLFGKGELLRIEAPISQNFQGVKADFTKPVFYDISQNLLAGLVVQREKTDAYTTSFANAYAGLERRLSWRWWGDARLMMEEGMARDNTQDNDYRYFGFRVGLKRDSRFNKISPTQGSLINVSLTPYYGDYGGTFHALASTVDASFYFSPFKGDRIVLAARGLIGMMMGSGRADIPPRLRYYAGGGGSVRGYGYQSIGPRDGYNDPVGGRSFNVLNLEARLKVTENFGVVPFLDGGSVYNSQFPDLGADMYWGVGLGLRYYTAIGPVRLDVGVPLRKQQGDDAFHVYISIGQAF